MNSSINRKRLVLILGSVIASICLLLFYMALRGNIFVPQSLDIGPISIRVYSLTALGGIMLGAFLFDKLAKKHKQLKKIQIDEALLYTIIPGVIFARVWYVLIFWSEYSDNLLAALQIWQGGLSIFGGLLGGMLGIYAYTKQKNINFIKTLELAVLSIPLEQIIGRFGNFVNQELYGPITDLPWGMYIRETGMYHHPAFLYEQIGNILLFLILYKLYKIWGLKGDGRLVAIYFLGYGIVRFVVDIFRNDMRIISGLTIAQIVVLVYILIASVYLVYLKQKNNAQT